MHIRRQSILAGLAAALVLGFAAATASAETMGVQNWERGFRVVWAALEFKSAAGETVRCPVTLEGSFDEKVIETVAGARYGDVTRAALPGSSCTGGRATVHTESLPWTVQYGSSTGALPNIASVTIRLVGARFSINAGESILCSATTTESRPAQAIATTRREAGGVLELPTLQADRAATIPLAGGFFCSLAGTGFLEGTGSMTVRGETAKLRLVAGHPGLARIEPRSPLVIRRPNREGSISIMNIARAGTGEPIEVHDIVVTAELANKIDIDDINRCKGIGRMIAPEGECNFHVVRRPETILAVSGRVQIIYSDNWHTLVQGKSIEVRYELIE